MSNQHEKKFVINMFLGLLFTTAGIASIIYSTFNKENQHDWIFWAIIPIITINTGLLFMGSAIVHKVKADLIRRQKSKSRTDRSEIA
jgi:uncharacterized membrane protein HdeD (DUF308 family)